MGKLGCNVFNVVLILHVEVMEVFCRSLRYYENRLICVSEIECEESDPILPLYVLLFHESTESSITGIENIVKVCKIM